MKVLVIDQGGSLLDFCMRAKAWGHDVKWWVPLRKDGSTSPVGDGYFVKPKAFEPWMKWADLIVVGDNSTYMRGLTSYFRQGFPIFGCNPEAARLELDRGHGQDVALQAGIQTVPFEIFTKYDDAIRHVENTLDVFVSKPWGGTADKDLSYVSQSPEDMICKLLSWKAKGKLQGQIMLQKKVSGIEMAVGGWFGKNGWSQYICENFEEKKFMNDGLGKNTGEQGTILRYVTESKLFRECLEPVTGYLHRINYVGYVDMNTMVRGARPAAPLEFTMRFGYPLFDIQSALHKGDFVTSMGDLLEGRDTIAVSDRVAVGVVLTHNNYPQSGIAEPSGAGVPLYGMTPALEPHCHFNEMQWGSAPALVGGKIKYDIAMPVTAGDYLMTVTGTGPTVYEACDKAYSRIWKLKPPTNRMFRTDIGHRLEHQLDELQEYGYATGMEYL
jgi:phosphoribosylamine--glycine ligase